MTPERLNELANWLMIEGFGPTPEEKEIAAYLRECAKAEPIAWLLHFKPPHGATYSYKEEITFLKSHAETMSKYALRVIPLYTHPPKQEQSPIDDRAEFEKWANKHNGGEPLQLGGGGTYTNPFANAAYEAWQAARKLSAPVVPDEFNPADWLWAWLADYCKHKGINPHHCDLFRACSDMRAAMLKEAK